MLVSATSKRSIRLTVVLSVPNRHLHPSMLSLCLSLRILLAELKTICLYRQRRQRVF